MALINSDDDRIIVFIVIIAIVFFLLQPKLEKEYFKNEIEIKDMFNKNAFHHKKCSKKCCKHNVYLPKYLKNKDGDDKYIASNLTCRGGCLCVEKDDITYLTKRGGNN